MVTVTGSGSAHAENDLKIKQKNSVESMEVLLVFGTHIYLWNKLKEYLAYAAPVHINCSKAQIYLYTNDSLSKIPSRDRKRSVFE